MQLPVSEHSDDVTVHLVLSDFKTGLAYVETAPAEADRETIVQNFLTGQYGNALRVVAFNTAEGWSWDVSEDIANEILQRAVGAYKSLSEATLRFGDRHIADLANPTPKTPTSPIDLIDSHKPEFDKRPAAPSVWRGLEGYAKYRARNIRKD
jgi:hypothetical protein